MEGLWLYASYQDAVGIDGEAIEFEWKNFPGFSSLSIFQVIQKDLERERNNSDKIHFNADASNTELFFQTTHSVDQLSIYGAVANWCHQFGLTEEEKGRTNFYVDNKMLASLQPEEVQLLVSPPTVALEVAVSRAWRDRKAIKDLSTQGVL